MQHPSKAGIMDARKAAVTFIIDGTLHQCQHDSAHLLQFTIFTSCSCLHTIVSIEQTTTNKRELLVEQTTTNKSGIAFAVSKFEIMRLSGSENGEDSEANSEAQSKPIQSHEELL
jgi:hypothetical protein